LTYALKGKLPAGVCLIIIGTAGIKYRAPRFARIVPADEDSFSLQRLDVKRDNEERTAGTRDQIAWIDLRVRFLRFVACVFPMTNRSAARHWSAI